MVASIYIACAYDKREEALGARDVLEAIGLWSTSSWLDQHSDGLTPDEINIDPEACHPFAALDFSDVMRADMLVSLTVFGPSTTGASHVELGIALAAGIRVAVVGPRENIFHTLGNVEHYDDWPRFVMAMAREIGVKI